MAVKRLDRLLSELGVATRSELRQMIKSGRITVDGMAAAQPDMKIEEQGHSICVDGVELRTDRLRYFMMDKPEGVLSATEDKRQETVLDILPPDIRRIGLFPVGRLDKDTSGLLLLTNDGDFANKLMHPRYHKPKTYHVKLAGEIEPEKVQRLSEPMEIDGYMTKPAEVSLITRKKEYSVVAITLFEGRNRQIRKMCEKLSLHVLSLRRVSIGEVKLGDLRPGKWRYLTKSQVQMLKKEAKSDV